MDLLEGFEYDFDFPADKLVICQPGVKLTYIFKDGDGQAAISNDNTIVHACFKLSDIKAFETKDFGTLGATLFKGFDIFFNDPLRVHQERLLEEVASMPPVTIFLSLEHLSEENDRRIITMPSTSARLNVEDFQGCIVNFYNADELQTPEAVLANHQEVIRDRDLVDDPARLCPQAIALVPTANWLWEKAVCILRDAAERSGLVNLVPSNPEEIEA